MNQKNKNINVPLSDQVQEIILGSLLGDGSLKIHKEYKNARFFFRHSGMQKEYFFWKVNQLKEISSLKCVFKQKGDGYSKNNKFRYQSKALELLTEIYQLTHKRKKFCIRRKWLNKMTSLSLAIWWFDDGSIIANGRKGVLCTDGFKEESVKVLARYLQVVWKIKTKVAPVKKQQDSKQKKYWRIWFYATSEFKKFLRIILPHVKISSLLFKIILLYEDHQLQQRWISEITHYTDFSEYVIKKHIDLKKSKWKNFRK